MKNSIIAKGTFNVELKPVAQDKIDGITFGKYSIDKIFQGDLEATSKLDMLSAGADNGSGAYVAIEQVNGKLNNKSGTFVLVHSGTRTKDSQHLNVFIVSGCSTGELAGLKGTMTINIVGKKHFYELEYSFA
jgi:Protein of unknown function (DUF3224)